MVAVVLAIGLILAIAVALLVAQAILRPLRQVRDVLSAVGEGDLTREPQFAAKQRTRADGGGTEPGPPPGCAPPCRPSPAAAPASPPEPANCRTPAAASPTAPNAPPVIEVAQRPAPDDHPTTSINQP
jgi:hypothetical protein